VLIITFQEEGSSQHFKVSTLSKHRTAPHFDLQICACFFSMYIFYFDNVRLNVSSGFFRLLKSTNS
jgi:hypothetical protein